MIPPIRSASPVVGRDDVSTLDRPIDRLVESIGSSSQIDAVTQALRQTIPPYLALMEKDFEKGQQFLLDLLEECLFEEWKGLPILEPLLGSDGKVYCAELLRIHFAYVQDEALLDCSPITQKPGFWVQDHQALLACMHYLKECGRTIENPQIINERKRLGHAALPLPNGHNQKTILEMRANRKPLFSLKQKLALAELKAQLVDAQAEELEMKKLKAQVAILTENERIANAVYTSEAVKMAFKHLHQIESECQEIGQRVVQLDDEISQLRQGLRQLQELNSQLISETEQMKAETEELKQILRDARKSFKKAIQLKRICFVVKVALFVVTGMPPIAAVVRTGVESLVDVMAARVIKNQQLAGIVSAGVNGGIFNPNERLVCALKASTQATFDVALSAAKVNPLVHGATTGGVADRLGNSDKLMQNVVLGATMAGASKELPVTVSASMGSKAEVKMNLRVKEEA